jgi:hypothetical protein
MTVKPEPVLHPLIDGLDVEADLFLTVTRATVVGLTEARADLLRSIGRSRLVLGTDERSYLTRPMRDALVGTGGVWMIDQGDGTFRDGVTGRQFTRLQDAVAAPSGPPTLETTSSVFLGRTPDGLGEHVAADIEARRVGQVAGVIQLSLSVRHRARQTTTLGRAAELAIERLTGAPPYSWGAHEPALARWDRAALTRYARGRAPQPVRLVVVGDGVIGTVLVRRTEDGLEEITTLDVVTGTPGSDTAREVTDEVPGLFDALGTELVPLFCLATTRTGRGDLRVPPELEAPPVPLQLLLGAPGVRQLEVDVDAAVREHDAVRLGKRRLPSLRFPLGTFDHADWDRTTRIVRWLGAEGILADLNNPWSVRYPEVSTDGGD